jgi:hypothetical protein
MVDRDITRIVEAHEHIPSTVDCIRKHGMIMPAKPDREDVNEIIKLFSGDV